MKVAEAQAATEVKVADVRIIAKADIATAVSDLKDAIADCKTSTLKWMFGMMTAFTGIVITSVVTLIVGLR